MATVNYSLKNQPETLDGDMQPRDVVNTLATLKVRGRILPDRDRPPGARLSGRSTHRRAPEVNIIPLKGHRLATVVAAADTLPPEKRETFLDRVAARLRVLGFRFSDTDLNNAVRVGRGLIQDSAA